MAKGGANSGFKISIGLRYDELNQDFVDVEKTISENIQKLNRKSNLIDIQAKINFIGLTDEAKKLEIIQQKLRQQIELQRNKVILYEDAATQSVKLYGVESKNADKAIYAYQQQRLELAKLSQQLDEVISKQNALPKNDTNSLLSGYQSFKGDIGGAIGKLTSAFTGLKDASQSADGAITKSLEIISSIPTPVGKAVAAFASSILVIKGVEKSLLDMARPAVAAGDSLYVMSRGMQISVKDMANLSMVSQVTGIEINEVNSAIRRLSASLTKADEKGNLASETLKKYGASIKDVNGNIKQGTALVEELAKAFERARALGKGAEFRDAVGGRFWSADFVTFLEDYTDNVVLAGKVVKNGLADPALFHSIQGELNAMNAQAKQLGSALSSAFAPVANYIVPHLRQRMGELTSVIQDNAETIKNVGYSIGEVVDKMGEFTTAVTKATIEVVKFLETSNAPDSSIVSKYLDKRNKEYKEFQELLNEYSKLQLQIEKNNEKLNTANETSNTQEIKRLTAQINELSQKAKEAKSALRQIFTDKQIESLTKGEQAALRYNQAIGYFGTFEAKNFADNERILNKILEENETQLRESTKAAEQKAEADKVLTAAVEQLNTSLDTKRIQQYTEELSKIKLDLKFDGNQYQKSLAEIEEWHKKALTAAGNNGEERLKIEELYRAKITQVRRNHAKDITKITEETANIEFARTHSAFEKQIRDIEQWKQAQIEKAGTAEEVAAIIANASAKEAKAFEDEVDRISGKIQSLTEKVFDQEADERQKAFYNLAKEISEYASEGIYDPALIQRYANNALKNIDANLTVDLTFDESGISHLKLPDEMYNLFDGVQNYVEKQKSLIEDMLKPVNLDKLSPEIDMQNIIAQLKEIENKPLNISANLNTLDLQQQLSAIEPESIKLTANLDAVTANISQSLTASTSQFENAMLTASNAATGFSNSLTEAVQKISTTNFAPSNSTEQTQQQNFYDNETLTVTLQALTQSNEKYLPNIVSALAPLDNITQELTNIAGSIAQENTNQQSQPVINMNVAPNITVNLGGAYVFDNAMKAQLTDDITAEVANAVTQAVNQGINDINISIAN